MQAQVLPPSKLEQNEAFTNGCMFLKAVTGCSAAIHRLKASVHADLLSGLTLRLCECWLGCAAQCRCSCDLNVTTQQCICSVSSRCIAIHDA